MAPLSDAAMAILGTIDERKDRDLDDRFRETGLDEAGIHGTGIMLVDSSFGKI
jgi:hypothetical protein